MQNLLPSQFRSGMVLLLDGVPHAVEEFVLTGEQVGERHWFLVENREYRALFVEGKLLDLALPEHVAMKVVETAQPQHGPSHGTAYKDATLEGGLRIMVPLFIRPGESVSVDTRTRKYFGKDAGG
jgi:elongation factor P